MTDWAIVTSTDLPQMEQEEPDGVGILLPCMLDQSIPNG